MQYMKNIFYYVVDIFFSRITALTVACTHVRFFLAFISHLMYVYVPVEENAGFEFKDQTTRL